MQNIVNITLDNFQQVILEQSQHTLIIVDFWADWCGPCKDLMPILEKIAGEYPNDVILAKVNCDEQPQIAAQFGVRSLPTVMLVKDAQPVDGFAGAQPEGPIREMLAKYLPNPEDDLLIQAGELIAAGDYQQAFPLVKQAFDLSPDNIDVKYALVDCQIELGNVATAKELLATIGLADQDGRYQALTGKIELAEQAADSPEVQALQQQLAAEPDNMELKVQLAVQLQQLKRNEEALELLYSVISKDLNFGDAKKIMLDVINALPDGEPLKSQYRRKVYSLLY